MIRHRLTTLLVVLITVVIAAPTLARSKKPKTKATQATLDPDLANELYAVLERATRSADMETRSLAVLNLARVRPETVDRPLCCYQSAHRTEQPCLSGIPGTGHCQLRPLRKAGAQSPQSGALSPDG